MKAFIDSDILIWHLRGEAKALHFFHSLKSSSFTLWTGALQRAEVLFFARPDEVEPTLLFLNQLQTAPVDQLIVDNAAGLYRRFHPSHGIDMPDAILASTCLECGGKIYTLNTKHFPIPDLIVERAW